MHIKRFNLIILTAFFLSSESVLGLLGNLVGRYRPTTIESKTFPLILQFGEKYDESSIGLQSVEGVFASRNEFEYIKSLAVTADAEARESLRMMAEDSFITTLEEDPLRDTQTYKQETLNIPFPKFEARRLKEYNLNLVQANEAHKFTKGKNAKVCLIDSGVDLQHLDLNEDLFSGLNLNTEMRWDIDLISHGTYLAGIISAKHNNAIEIEGIAPEAEIFVIRVFENTSREFEFASGLVKAVERCAIAGARIINLSLGGYKKSELEQQGFSELVNRYDLLIVAAGGNKGFSAPPLYPASYSDIVSVGAVNEYKERWFFSQADVDIVAPGTDVLGLKGGTQDGFERSSGTSIACAHVTAVAALLWSWKPCATLLEIKTALFMSAESLGNDREFGYGLVQAMDALIYLNGGLLLIANSSPNGICSPADTNASKPTKYPTLAPSFEATPKLTSHKPSEQLSGQPLEQLSTLPTLSLPGRNEFWRRLQNQYNEENDSIAMSDDFAAGYLLPDIGQFQSLTSLTIAYCENLVGKIPTEIGLLTNLKALNLGLTNLSGTIPTEIGMLTKLGNLWIESRHIYGKIPKELSQLSNTLTNLNLMENALDGTIPSEIGLLTEVTNMAIQRNELIGTIPTEFGLLSSIDTIEFSNNNLSGTIPTQLGLLKRLAALFLNNNNLSGTIPTQLVLLAPNTESAILFLNNNDLSGTIPTQLALLSDNTEIVLDYNNLSGTIPAELAKFPYVSYLGNPSLQG
eukprot:CAMPEP_0194166574 /NCGR_PEP_ID=MMETSP0154-20130528/2140_1 /TAXON_ID=1049557 /ORGANISM="Thalassiothrix antarctica, Strain L6-D1" /LENGTH=745 /DNA_ID=CAMNT_0038877279 /DNA_START=29 /DNA_END=2266 /DNA_ORIENTATION=+